MCTPASLHSDIRARIYVYTMYTLVGWMTILIKDWKWHKHPAFSLCDKVSGRLEHSDWLLLRPEIGRNNKRPVGKKL